MPDALQAILDYQLLGGSLNAYTLEMLDNMEYYRYLLMQICKSADIAAQNKEIKKGGRGKMQEKVNFGLDENDQGDGE